MKRIIILSLFCLISIYSKGQLIKGTVFDKNASPIAFATISLFNKEDSSFVDGVISDSNGCFQIEQKQNHEYYLSVSCIGYKTKYITNICDTINVFLDLQETLLEDVVVRSHMPKMRIVSGGTRILVSGSFLADAGKATDILSMLPRVKNSDEGITVLGKGQPAIYIDNREIKDPTELERISSRKIKSIEVLTNPGTRYSAEKKCVIIINTHDKNEGFSIELFNSNKLSSGISTKNTANMSYHIGKISLYNNFMFCNKKTDIDQNAINTINGKEKILIQTTDKSHKNRFRGIVNRTGIDIDINANNHIGGFYEISRNYPTIYDVWDRNEKRYINEKPNTDIFISQIGKREGGPNHYLNLYYSGAIGKLKIDINSMLYWMKKNTEKEQTEKTFSDTEIISSSNKTKGNIIANKVILSYNLTKNLHAEAGTEITSTISKQNYISKSDLIASSMADIEEKRSACFFDMSFNTASFSISGGLRYEHLSNTTINTSSKDSKMSYTYNNCFPNIQIGYSNNNLEMSCAYSSKITRPTYSQLSNNVSYDMRYIYEGGNPNLKSTIEHMIECSISYSWLNLSLEYEHDSNPIYNWYEWYDSERSIAKLTSINIKNIDYVTASIVAQPVIGVWHPIVEFDLNKQFLNASKYMVYENLRTLGFTGLFDNHFIFKTWQIGVSYRYVSNMAEGFVKAKSTNLLNIEVKKKLFNNKLLVQLKLNDILDANHNRYTLYTPISTMWQDRSNKTRSVLLSVFFNLYAKNKIKHSLKPGAGNAEKDRL